MAVEQVVKEVVVVIVIQIVKVVQVSIILAGIVQHVSIIVQDALDNVRVRVLAHVEVVHIQ